MRLSNGIMSVNVTDEHGDELPIEEEGWSVVAQNIQRMLDGANVIQESRKKAGQPLTFICDENTWVYRHIADSLSVMANQPGQRMTLDRFNETYNVTFRHTDGPAVEIEDVHYESRPHAGIDHIRLTLKLITI